MSRVMVFTKGSTMRYNKWSGFTIQSLALINLALVGTDLRQLSRGKMAHDDEAWHVHQP